MIIRNITKEYPDMIKVKFFKVPVVVYERENTVKRNKAIVREEDFKPFVSSLSRTKALVRDIILCNDFELFCTFTFDPDKVDRYSYQACLNKMSTWLHHQKNNSDDFAYIIIPEHHKDGAFHFHALISHYKGSLRDSKHFSSTGRRVYNITSFRSGFSTAVKIDDKEIVSNYVTKYITKDFVKMFNRRRFISSMNLKRPIRTINSPLLDSTPPLFKRKTYEDSDCEYYSLSPL